MSISGDLVMTENKPAADVTKDWQATQGQKSAATRLRLFAALSWIIALRKLLPDAHSEPLGHLGTFTCQPHPQCTLKVVRARLLTKSLTKERDVRVTFALSH